jgi:hypothetical protein
MSLALRQLLDRLNLVFAGQYRRAETDEVLRELLASLESRHIPSFSDDKRNLRADMTAVMLDLRRAIDAHEEAKSDAATE